MDRRAAERANPSPYLGTFTYGELVSDKSSEPVWERKPIQIAGDPTTGVIVLCNDGTMWLFNGDIGPNWHALKPVPQP